MAIVCWQPCSSPRSCPSCSPRPLPSARERPARVPVRPRRQPAAVRGGDAAAAGLARALPRAPPRADAASRTRPARRRGSGSPTTWPPVSASTGSTSSQETYDVLLSSPARGHGRADRRRSRSGALARPTARTRCPRIPDSGHPRPSAWHAYAKSGIVEGEVVYANHGRALRTTSSSRSSASRCQRPHRAGAALQGLSRRQEPRGRAARRPGSRHLLGPRRRTATCRATCLPRGPWGPDSHVQRGANVYDFIVPGDPLTPGWASLPGARRIAEEDSRLPPDPVRPALVPRRGARAPAGAGRTGAARARLAGRRVLRVPRRARSRAAAGGTRRPPGDRAPSRT